MPSFTVGGKRISLTPQIVEDLLEGIVEIDPLNKNFVVVRGRRFPVKQALSLAANIPLSSFISTEAVRVFKALGFDVGRVGGERGAARNESELLLQQYLQNNGLGNYRFEPPLQGTLKRPDYSLSFGGSEILLEVKQFDPTPEDFKVRGGAYDPYAPIKEKIEAGRKKFKDLDKGTCCLVLFNRGRPLVDLSWRFVYGAMLGRLAIRMPFDPARGQMVEEQAVQGFFGGEGKMRPSANGEPTGVQNRKISAIIVLEHLHLGQRRFLADVRQKEADQGREFGYEELTEMLDKATGTERDWGLLQLRVVTCENPDARNPLPDELFTGPFDERYGGVEGRIVRKYCGVEIVKLEAEEERAKQSRERKRRDPSALPLNPRREISLDDDAE